MGVIDPSPLASAAGSAGAWQNDRVRMRGRPATSRPGSSGLAGAAALLRIFALLLCRANSIIISVMYPPATGMQPCSTPAGQAIWPLRMLRPCFRQGIGQASLVLAAR
jgi:hypothetical protein